MTDEAKIEFTKAGLLAAPTTGKRFDIHDPRCRGLVCTVTPAGARTFYVVRKVKGQSQRVRIGQVTDVPLAAARKAAEKIKTAIALGADPAREKREAREAATLGELWELFLERHAKARKRSWSTDVKRWGAHLAKWSGRRVKDITRADVVRLLDDVTRNAGPIQANRVRALLHTMFRVAQRWGWEVGNPVAGTPRNRENRRKRFLAPHELRSFIRACRAEEEPVTADVLLLLLFTGTRPHSLLSAEVGEFDLRGGLWRIPPEHAKAGRELLVPLAPAAAAIVAQRLKALPKHGYLFPSTRRPQGYVTMPRAGLERVALRAGLGRDVTAYVLRHTFSTSAEAVGVPRAIVGNALGHTQEGGITATYMHVNIDLVRLAVEKVVAAMLKLADASDEEAERGNVLSFPVPAWAREEAGS